VESCSEMVKHLERARERERERERERCRLYCGEVSKGLVKNIHCKGTHIN